jgi:hypothetical protein
VDGRGSSGGSIDDDVDDHGASGVIARLLAIHAERSNGVPGHHPAHLAPPRVEFLRAPSIIRHDMTRPRVHALTLALTPALVLAWVVALAWTGGAASRTSGCSVNIKLHSTMPTDVDDPTTGVLESTTIAVDLDKSKVKIKGGFWKSLGYGEEQVYAGATEQRTFNLTFGCGVKRRYKFFIQEDLPSTASYGSSKTVYFPGPNSWTTRQSFKVNLHLVPSG